MITFPREPSIPAIILFRKSVRIQDHQTIQQCATRYEIATSGAALTTGVGRRGRRWPPGPWRTPEPAARAARVGKRWRRGHSRCLARCARARASAVAGTPASCPQWRRRGRPPASAGPTGTCTNHPPPTLLPRRVGRGPHGRLPGTPVGWGAPHRRGGRARGSGPVAGGRVAKTRPHAALPLPALLGHTACTPSLASVASAARRCRRGRERRPVSHRRRAGWPGHGPTRSTSPTFCRPAVGT